MWNLFNWKVVGLMAVLGAGIGAGAAALFGGNLWIHMGVYAAFGALTAFGATFLPAKVPALSVAAPVPAAAAA